MYNYTGLAPAAAMRRRLVILQMLTLAASWAPSRLLPSTRVTAGLPHHMCASIAQPVTARPVSFATTSVSIQGQSVPVAIWCPTSLLPESWRRTSTDAYEYKIDVGRIATKLEVDWLSWLPSRRVKLARAGASACNPPSDDERLGDGLIFAHGFLGSPFDMAHACEALACDGFIVVAPECPESLSASYESREGLNREAIVRATQQAVDATVAQQGDGAPRRWGIFGHSAGSATAILHPGEFALGRVCVATAIGRVLQSSTSDPLFLVASEGDGCNEKMAEQGVSSPRAALTLARVSKSPPFTAFESANDAYARPPSPNGQPPPRRGVLLFQKGRDALLPNHMSFLWRDTNEALFELLAPLLPLARGLGLFLLDFDTERDARLAVPTAAQLVPAMRRFYGTWRAAGQEKGSGNRPSRSDAE